MSQSEQRRVPVKAAPWWSDNIWLYSLRHPLYEDALPRWYFDVYVGKLRCWLKGGHDWAVYGTDYGNYDPPCRQCQRCETFQWL